MGVHCLEFHEFQAASSGETGLHFLPDPRPSDGTDQRHICLYPPTERVYKKSMPEEKKEV
jgi:hypothetical protein